MNKSSRNVLTFKGGIHPAGNGKDMSSAIPSRTAPLLERYRVLIHQNTGKPPIPTVKKGDKIKKYQRIAEADGFVSADLHAPTSGEVSGIIEVPGPMGVPAQAIEIISDGEDAGDPPFEPLDWTNASPEALLKRVSEAGLVGMGGASFPTHVKLSLPPGKSVDTLIVNGAECEPYLTADHRLMLERGESLLRGTVMLGRILGVKRLCIGAEINKHDALEYLTRLSRDYDVEVVPLEVRYPQGSEKHLIRAIAGREVPSGGLPADAGCVVQNVATAAAFDKAVRHGTPLIERIVTVTGEVVKNPGNWRLRIGTPVIKAIELANGVTAEPGKLILGGPMMGFAQRSFEIPISKNTSGILLLPPSMALNYGSTGCIRCGRCVQGCPMHLVPSLLATAIEGDRYDLASQNHVMDCIECGSCAYVCPAHRPLVQHFRRAKAELRRKK